MGRSAADFTATYDACQRCRPRAAPGPREWFAPVKLLDSLAARCRFGSVKIAE